MFVKLFGIGFCRCIDDKKKIVFNESGDIYSNTIENIRKMIQWSSVHGGTRGDPVLGRGNFSIDVSLLQGTIL